MLTSPPTAGAYRYRAPVIEPDYPLALSYDDVLLVPRRSGVGSRSHPVTTTRFSRRIRLELPVVSANMDTVTEHAMAAEMARLGGLGVIHRFLSVERQCAEVAAVVAEGPENDRSTPGRAGGLAVAAAVGVQTDARARASALAEAGADALVVDVAHGHAEHVFAAMQAVREEVGPELDLVVGNVATAEGARDLAQAGADAVKVGVGPGSACTTRVVTGVGVPQLSAVLWCSEALADADVPLIADGGIRAGGDVAKALAAGGDCVMVGNVLARSVESPGETVEHDGRAYKTYRGMASHGAAATRPGSAGRRPDAAEGVEGLVPLAGSASELVRQLVGGLRSSMSYAGALDLPSFRERARFVRITAGGLRESLPHDLLQNGDT
jgi:IMP dehydrogenase